jgi:hypothetical protein
MSPRARIPETEPPPFLGTWRRVYSAVLTYLAVLVVLLYVITRVFHY